MKLFRMIALTTAVAAATPAKAFDLAELFGHHSTPHSTPLLDVAKRYVGARNFTGLRAPWCRAFINRIADRAGVPLANRSNRAIDALALGRRVSTPRAGDLAVMRHHVTIFAGYSNGRIVGLGGNQSHRVQYSKYSPTKVIAYVRVAGR